MIQISLPSWFPKAGKMLFITLFGAALGGCSSNDPEGGGASQAGIDYMGADAEFEAGQAGGLKNGGEVLKVKSFHLDIKDKKSLKAVDPMVRNARARRVHGAITPLELRHREGHYYTVFWRTEDRQTPVTVRFEFRQADTGDEVFVKEIAVDRIGRTNTTEFQVTGDEYKDDGNVLSWQASVVQGGNLVATYPSFLWE